MRGIPLEVGRIVEESVFFFVVFVQLTLVTFKLFRCGNVLVGLIQERLFFLRKITFYWG